MLEKWMRSGRIKCFFNWVFIISQVTFQLCVCMRYATFLKVLGLLFKQPKMLMREQTSNYFDKVILPVRIGGEHRNRFWTQSARLSSWNFNVKRHTTQRLYRWYLIRFHVTGSNLRFITQEEPEDSLYHCKSCSLSSQEIWVAEQKGSASLPHWSLCHITIIIEFKLTV